MNPVNDGGPMAQMPQYQCYKKVWALEIAEIAHVNPDTGGEKVFLKPKDPNFAAIEVSIEWARSKKPHKGGYLVQYEDGYRSFSPKKAFEEGYTPITEGLGQALHDKPATQKVTQGRIVIYTLTADDAEQINRRRTTGKSIAARLKTVRFFDDGAISGWPAGAQAHIGNTVKEGDQFPAIVVKVSGYFANLQVFLDGSDTFWAQLIEEVVEGDALVGRWAWPLQI